MERYRCDPDVMKCCKTSAEYGCDGEYFGADCDCARDNQAVMRLTELEELRSYRATGLTVERATELGKADQEGRVTIEQHRQVNVGDRVYTIRDNAVIGYCVTVKSEGYGWMTVLAHRHDGRLSFGLLDIGKTVFLTREEAEKSIGGGKS